MKKILTLVVGLVCIASVNARDLYLVGDATPADWDLSWLNTTKMTEVSTDVYEWTGVLFTGTGEGFKILTQTDWNPAIHPSTGGLAIDTAGSDEVDLPYSDGTDSKWTVSETAVYKITVTFRESDVLVECEKVSDVVVDGYLQVSSADLLLNFSRKIVKGRIGGGAYNVALTQDINLNSVGNWTPIGTDGTKFIATFDGQGHKITNMTIDGSKDQQGFFGVLGAGAIIKNLIMDSSCTITSSGGATLAAFAAVCNNSGEIKFENCGNEANVTGQKQNNAGFLGCNYGGSTTLVFNNCYNKGTISGGWENGAFSGWTGGGATFNNCYSIGEVNNGESGKSWARGSKTCYNCYQTVGDDGNITTISSDLLTSGELCYKLNGDQSAIGWYQTIGTDEYPVPSSTGHSQVYANGEMNCDGTAKAGGTLTYSNESTSVVPDHEYENGFCKNCDKYQENALAASDGWYVVSEPWHLRWMAVSVTEHNATYGDTNIKLAADINYTAYKSDLFGRDQSTAFKGIFDGQGHTITIDVVNNGTSRTGLFAYINAATIKNLIVEGSATSAGNNCVGGLGGRSDGNGTLIENVVVKTNVSYTGSNGDATCGGFFANMEGQITLKNCAFFGSINTGEAEGNGGLVGWAGSGSNNKYINCLVVPVDYTQKGNSADFARNNPSITNCYKVASNDSKLASGELCYLLNGDQSTIAWYQKLGEDTYPMPFVKNNAQIYLNATYLCPNKTEGEGTYSNSSESDIPDHSYVNGYCEYCSKADVNFLTPVNEFYEIDNMYKLNWFSHIVNEGNTTANAKLTADIVMESENQYGYAPIGSTDNPYIGHFDGDGHSVTLKINNPGYDYQGLFGVITDGVSIEKVIVKGYIVGKAYVGGIVGGTNGGSSNAKKTNIWYCGNEATVTAKDKNGAGIIGVNMSGSASIIITNCYNTGDVTSSSEGGAFSGWLGGGWSSVRNCYNSGTIKNGENTSKAFGRNNGCYFTNCYYTATSGTDNSTEDHANGQPVSVEDAAMASGELCYKLCKNGDSSFSQNIGTDACPVYDGPEVSYVGDAGYATLYDTTTGYELNGDVKVYAATFNSTWLELTEIENIPASTPVILKGSYYNKFAQNLPAINVANVLMGTAEEIDATGMYVLAKPADKAVGFYLADGGKIAAGKAYLEVPGTEVKGFTFAEDGETGIVSPLGETEEGVIYNLAGQRISKMQKGINIVGGKKVLK